MTELFPPPGTPSSWRPDPSLPHRLRYWDGSQWTEHVSFEGEGGYTEPYLGPGETRWQYGIVNIGMYQASERMQMVLAAAGEAGWHLIAVYDKASNWMNGMEKGFMLFRRTVPPGVRLAPDEWCATLDGRR